LAAMQRIFIILAFFLLGCGTTSNITATNLIAEENKDVLILTSLIRDHLRRTNGRDLNLNELIQNDTLRRISNNFEKAELKSHGGYISVSYKLSASRNKNVELTSKERELLNGVGWADKALPGQYDGEIRFDYGERFYHIKKIIVKKE
jgi:hypothetical protein